MLSDLKFPNGEYIFSDKEVILRFIDYTSVFIIQNNMANQEKIKKEEE